MTRSITQRVATVVAGLAVVGGASAALAPAASATGVYVCYRDDSTVLYYPNGGKLAEVPTYYVEGVQLSRCEASGGTGLELPVN